MQEQEIQKVSAMVTFKTVDGKYQIKQSKLGEGSFAKTYLCLISNVNKIIACKMISKQDLINKINQSKNKTLTKQYFVNALKTEVKTWKSLHNSNVVQFIDFSETQNNIYFFLEYCSGGNLQTLLRKRGTIPQAQALHMMYQIASGCLYLYNLGIFHRDIKPQNILIGKQGILKITDFGFAKAIEKQEDKNQSMQGTSVGTPIYMSPQVLLHNPYTIKCDVWSLGVVFYKMLNGLIPWQHSDNLNILVERMKQTIVFPPNIKVEDWLKQMIKRMLSIEEANRLSIQDVHSIISEKLGIMKSQ